MKNRKGSIDVKIKNMAKALLKKGHDKRLIFNIIFYLHPERMEIAENYLSFKNGKWGHPMVTQNKSTNKKCKICQGVKVSTSKVLI